MMKRTSNIVIGWVALVALLGFVPTQAAEQTFELATAKVKMDVPTEWKAANDLFGLPLVILGPEVPSGRRATISVIPTGLTGAKFDTKALGSDQKSYQKARKEWLSQYNGKALEFFPYKNAKWGEADVHSVGYRYEINGEKIVENTHFVVCKDQLFHVQSMTTDAQAQAYKSAIDQSLRSFTCN